MESWGGIKHQISSFVQSQKHFVLIGLSRFRNFESVKRHRESQTILLYFANVCSHHAVGALELQV